MLSFLLLPSTVPEPVRRAKSPAPSTTSPELAVTTPELVIAPAFHIPEVTVPIVVLVPLTVKSVRVPTEVIAD